MASRNRRTERPDALVVGGGIIGCAAARELARRGLKVAEALTGDRRMGAGARVG